MTRYDKRYELEESSWLKLDRIGGTVWLVNQATYPEDRISLGGVDRLEELWEILGMALNDLREEGDQSLRSVDETEDRLRELHGRSMDSEMGGHVCWAEAKALLWVLGYDDPDPKEGRTPPHVDVSDYIDVEEE